ncbi:MAG: hypothetical protein KDC12_06245 [Flavobacteriales bacterium]|nr:hypothetical protein [Flavobacteriales bacterium]
MPLITFIVASAMDPFLVSHPQVGRFLYTVLIINVLAPTLSVWLMHRRGLITSTTLDERKERLGPFLVVIAYYFISYWFLRPQEFALSPQLVAMFAGVWISLLISMLITLKWKISIHMLAQGGFIGTLMALNQVHFLNAGNIVVLLVLVSGWVGFARLVLKAHTHAQVYAGFLLGWAVNYVVILNAHLF